MAMLRDAIIKDDHTLLLDLRLVCREFRALLKRPVCSGSVFAAGDTSRFSELHGSCLVTFKFNDTQELRGITDALGAATRDELCNLRRVKLQQCSRKRLSHATLVHDFLEAVQEGGLDTLIMDNIRVRSMGDLKYYTFSRVKHVKWLNSKLDANSRFYIYHYFITDGGRIEFD